MADEEGHEILGTEFDDADIMELALMFVALEEMGFTPPEGHAADRFGLIVLERADKICREMGEDPEFSLHGHANA